MDTAQESVDLPVIGAAPRWLRGVFWANLVAQIGIVITGGIVRVTGSGLGCPTWPECVDGSITQTSGGSLIYRTSKAALNMAGKNLSIAFADKQVAVILVHPGWVKTDMGGPGAAITPVESVTGLRKVIAGATFASSGHFYNYDGSEFPW